MYVFSLKDFQATAAQDRSIIFTTDIGKIKVLGANITGTQVNFQSTTAINDGLWYMVTIQIANGIKKLFIDGTDDNPTFITGNATNSYTLADIVGSDNCVLGAYSQTGSTTIWGLNGFLSNFYIWNTILSSADITALYNEVLGTPSSYTDERWFNGYMAKPSFYNIAVDVDSVNALATEAVQPTSNGYQLGEYYNGNIKDFSAFDRKITSDEFQALNTENTDDGGNLPKYPYMQYTFEIS